MGRFKPEKARERGIPEGRLWGKIQKGEAVNLPDGRTIQPSELVGPTRPGRRIVLTGDSRPSEATITAATGADVLVHEATFAEEEAPRALEGTIEALRAGAIPLESETVPAPFATDAHGLVVTLVVTGTDVPALFDVKAEARFVVAGEPRRRGLETLIWAPP